jgi:hypothetical protein
MFKMGCFWRREMVPGTGSLPSFQGGLAIFSTIGFEGQKDPDREKND